MLPIACLARASLPFQSDMVFDQSAVPVCMVPFFKALRVIPDFVFHLCLLWEGNERCEIRRKRLR